MIRRPPRSTHCISSAASDVYKRQYQRRVHGQLPLSQDQKITDIPGIISKHIQVNNQYNCQFRQSKSQLGLRESFVLAKNVNDIAKNLKEKIANKLQAQQQNKLDQVMGKIMEQQD
eukprot:TRINITY_DN32435_c0_g1_i1.p4 TRINITY_DN32435_c0_g1~~TRINITY_DN32435_c0_g1_i1.p4  ORF type:complete len:116 (+),score=44.03 TRINITY_DN32435_c0_g1_i1:110-457(+)